MKKTELANTSVIFYTLSYKYTSKQGESSETLPVLINIDLGHLRSQVMIIT